MRLRTQYRLPAMLSLDGIERVLVSPIITLIAFVHLLMFYSPFYRNHNDKATIGQEAYRWSSVSEAARRAISVRYSLLTYMYTLFYYAHTEGQTVMRALAWEFPEDESLRATYAQFLLGPSILVTPVLAPNVETVQGVFPGIGEGTRWYDWYTLAEVQAKPQENVTMDAPLEQVDAGDLEGLFAFNIESDHQVFRSHNRSLRISR